MALLLRVAEKLKMSQWRMLWAGLALGLGVLVSPVTQANSTDGASPGSFFDNWFGSDAPPLSDAEFTSLSCIAAATSVGLMVTLVGGAAIAVSGSGRATGTAIALPVLASTMWAACAVGVAAAPGVLWLQRRSKTLVNKLGNAVKNSLHSTPETPSQQSSP